jgi:signal transduction histidine kinase
MVQLRRILGLLEERGDPDPPPPRLERLPDLVAAVGPRVSLVTTGASRPVPAEVEVAAYRIVQEALTNVIKHADAESATVELAWTDDDLVITVVDDGPHARAAGDLPSPGNGLAGIGERAAACGGTAWFGPAPGSRGFQVSARLPTGVPSGRSVS